MNKSYFSILVVTFVLTSTAFAQKLPSYYPAEGFQHTGRVDAVYIQEERVVIDDISYQVSNSVVVHSLSSFSVSRARVRQGVLVAFKMGGGRVIEEFWLLPGSYGTSK